MKNINSRANHVAVKKKRGSWNWSLFVEVMNVWPQRFSLFQKKFRVPNVKKIKDIHFYKLHKNICHTKTSQGRRGRGAEGVPHTPTHTPPPHTHTISWSKIFFPRKIRTRKIFTCEEHIRLKFTYWTRHKWQKVDSFFSFCHFSSKLSYHSCQQRVCKIMFPIRTFVKTNSNLMCGSFLLCQVIARTTDTKTKSKIISR